MADSTSKRRSRELSRKEKLHEKNLGNVRKEKSKILEGAGFEEKKSHNFLWILIFIVIVIAIVWFFFFN